MTPLLGIWLAACGASAPGPDAPSPAPESPAPEVPTPAPPAPEVAFQPTGSAVGHCTSDERMRFSCPVKGGKVLSLCEGPTGLSYRFGPAGAPELRIPADGYADTFERFHRQRGEDAEIVRWSTWNAGHRYAITIERTEDQFEGALSVRKGATALATIGCTGGVAADLTDLDGRFPGDPSLDTAWIGSWGGGEASLRVEPRDGGLWVKGDATWHGANPGQVHTGEIEGPLTRVDATRFAYRKDGCELTLRWMEADTLDGESNHRCGGMNVTFSWEYLRDP